MIQSIQFKLIAAGLIAGTLFGSGWKVRSWYDDAQQAAIMKAEKKTQDLLQTLSNEVATKTETAIQGIRIENRTIYNKTQKEILRDTVYRDCVLPPAGVQLVNQARQGTASSIKSANPVSGNTPVK